jgi:hypothetical protein
MLHPHSLHRSQTQRNCTEASSPHAATPPAPAYTASPRSSTCDCACEAACVSNLH